MKTRTHPIDPTGSVCLKRMENHSLGTRPTTTQQSFHSRLIGSAAYGTICGRIRQQSLLQSSRPICGIQPTGFRQKFPGLHHVPDPSRSEMANLYSDGIYKCGTNYAWWRHIYSSARNSPCYGTIHWRRRSKRICHMIWTPWWRIRNDSGESGNPLFCLGTPTQFQLRSTTDEESWWHIQRKEANCLCA